MPDHTAEPVPSTLTRVITTVGGTCVDCGDDIWPNEAAYEAGDALRCVICQAKLTPWVPDEPAEPLAQGGIVTPDAQPDAEDDPPGTAIPMKIEISPDAEAALRDQLRRLLQRPHRLKVLAGDTEDERERAAYERGKAEGIAEGESERAELRGALEETRLLLEQAEQYARDLQDDGINSVPMEAAALMARKGIAEGRQQGIREAVQVVRAQADLPSLMHFDRPSDFRKGVLTCLAALEARQEKSETGGGQDGQ